MDKTVLEICRILNKAGHQCFLVGGAVRDILMGRAPKDFDLVTDATPTQVEKLFKKTVSVGKQFGVIVVIEDGKPYEVATFRSEHGYSDARHPDTVGWTTPERDAERRDFTINALFYDPVTSEVTDYVNGKSDLEAKFVRFIGDPAARIEEDHLRLLRAVRLRNELGFEYEPVTWQAIATHASEIASVSAQRIRDELNKILLTAGRVQALEDLDESGLLKVILPELEALHGINQEWKFHGKGDVLTHTLLAVKVLPQDIKLEVVWGTLLHDIGKPATKATVPDKRFGGTRTGFYGHHEVGAKIAEELLRRLRFPNDQIELIVWLVRHHMMIHEILEMRVGRQKRWLLDPRLPDLLELHRADASGKGEGKRINLQAYQEVKKLMQDERAKPPPPPKLIDGNDLMKEFKLKPGPRLGELLKLVEDAVWEGVVKTKEEALQYVKKQLK
ncbi:CCA tRNA nucleotidyltransferase [Candidatus Berkelbacteria bacterium]|nr:CCA tRNA nucleotidyltransferase [Candidatus Berkelbacteria bacterium]